MYKIIKNCQRQQGILPEELVRLPFEHFKEDAPSVRIQKKRMLHHESKRADRYRIVTETYNSLVKEKKEKNGAMRAFDDGT
jgi:hypothetical protein